MTERMPNVNRGSDTTMGALPHVLALLFGFLGPLIVYLFSEDDYVEDNAAEALNWSLSFLVYSIISLVGATLFIGIPLLLILGVLNTVFPIIGAIKANQGEIWSYPFTIGFVQQSKNTQRNQRNNRQARNQQARDQQTHEEQYGGVEYGSIQEEDEEKTQEEKISELKNSYMRGEISEERFNELLDKELSEDEDKDYSQQYN